MPDVMTLCESVLHSVWLLPSLTVMIGADGPLPVLPSETLLMSAAAFAFGRHDAIAVLGLFVAAVIGSVVGDLLVFGLGRSSNRLLARTVDVECGLALWVRRHLVLRPGIALVGARFVPGGRLLSTAAAGRFGLTLRRFVPWSIASSAAWSVYILGVGALLGPLTGGNPLLSLLAGVVMAVVTAGAFALVARLRRPRHRWSVHVLRLTGAV